MLDPHPQKTLGSPKLDSKSNPDDETETLKLSKKYLGKMQYNKALAMLEEGLKKSADDGNLYCAKVDALFTIGKNEKAVEFIENTIDAFIKKELKISQKHIFELVAKKIDFLKSVDNYDQITAAYDELLKAEPNNIALLMAKGTVMISHPEISPAKDTFALFDEIIKRDPKYSEAYHMKAQALRLNKQYDEAILAIDTALQLEPKNLIFKATKGKILLYIHTKAQQLAALQIAQDILKMSPKNTDALYIMVIANLSLGNDGKAREMYKQFNQALKPGNAHDIALDKIMTNYLIRRMPNEEKAVFDKTRQEKSQHLISSLTTAGIFCRDNREPSGIKDIIAAYAADAELIKDSDHTSSHCSIS